MESHAERSEELPEVIWDDHINNMEIIDIENDPHRARGNETLTEEAYGMIKGWKDTEHCYIHDIVSVRHCIKLQTKAWYDETASPKKFINSPDAVEFYSMWLSYARKCDKIYINTTNPDLAREIHCGFFEVLMQSDSASTAFHWLTKESRYAKMQSEQDSGIALVDHMPMSARKKIRETKY